MRVGVVRVDAGVAGAIDERLGAGDEPFVITKSVGEGVRAGVWSPANLRARLGAREAALDRSETCRFDFDDEGRQRYTTSRATVAEALDLVEGARPPGPCYYMRGSRLSELGLDDAESLPRAFQSARGATTKRLWVSSAGSVTPLHYDTRNNFLAQMHGRKFVTLLPASEHERAYPLGYNGGNLLSLADPDRLDAARFPRFPTDLLLDVMLTPGDTLYIPPFWWHQVQSINVCVSVNVFWQLRAEQTLVANSVEYLRILYARDKLERLLADGREDAGVLLARLAERAHARGLDCAAALLCAGSARATLSALTNEERDALSADERRKVEHWTFVGDIVARTGKTPRSDEIESMLAGVTAFASHPV